MAGHSHLANIKHRKDRQDNARSQLFLKLRHKILKIIEKEGKITNKVLKIARENKFSKEKIYQIYEKINREKSNSFQKIFFQAPFSILIYLENNEKISEEIVKKLKLRIMPSSLISNYFQPIYSLKLQSKENLEDYLINLPSSVWENINYQENNEELISNNKEAINNLKKYIKEDKKIEINEEKIFWKPLIFSEITTFQEKEYYQKLEKTFEGKKFYTNVKVKIN